MPKAKETCTCICSCQAEVLVLEAIKADFRADLYLDLDSKQSQQGRALYVYSRDEITNFFR